MINPPVDLPKFKTHPANGRTKFKVKDYYLTGGRLEGAKNFELIIEACNKIKVPLKIYGTGSREKYLRSIAGPTVEFLGRVSDEEKFELMSKGKAFIVAATNEDFGITPVEAMATGCPVIAFRGGGYLETVVEGSPRGFTLKGKTGIFFNEQTVESLTKALREFKDSEGKIKPEDCRKQAEKFSKERFKREIMNFVKSKF